MPHIPIKTSTEADASVVYFPIPIDGNLTLDDLRSAFPNISSLRYVDENDSKELHVLCRDNVFVSPDDGWDKEGRVYLAVNNIPGQSSTRFGVFDSYRRQIASSSRQRQNITTPATNTRKLAEPETTMITVGHGHFHNGKFSKISATSLTGCGGLVHVGPFLKLGDTSGDIRKAAFEKFRQLNRLFRQKYKRIDQFVLVYQDGCLVDKLPDQSDSFSLKGYKDFIDPSRRYERLRLYLCEKGNFNMQQPIELVTDESSSDEELPRLSVSDRRKSSLTSDDDTLPLTTDVVFIYGATKSTESFPNNTAGSELYNYCTHSFSLEPSTFILKNGSGTHTISPDDRLLEVTSESKLDVLVLLDLTAPFNRSVEEGESDDSAIPASFDQDEATNEATKIAQKTLAKMSGTSEPTAILRELQKQFLRGRPLDLINDENIIEGETTQIYVRRKQEFKDAVEELQYAINIRFPIDVTFLGEEAQDFGGPRKEFFDSVIGYIKETLITQDADGKMMLRQEDGMIAQHWHYYAGLLIGLSAIEGGCLASFLDNVISNGPEGEEKRHLMKGLARTGVAQLIQKKPTVKYLFRPRTSPLTVNLLLNSFNAKFSEEGSNRRQAEEKSFREFVRYTREVFAGRRADGKITLQKILKFTTGCLNIPVLGLTPNPTIEFVEAALPTSSTCINRLYLPLQHDDAKYDLAFLNDFFGLQ